MATLSEGVCVGRIYRVIFFVCFVFLFGHLQNDVDAQTGQGTLVRQILVEGNQRIEVDTVLSYMQIREGDRFDDRQMDKSLKSLFATGLFADVRIKRQGENLVVSLIENPVINRIAFEGNKKIDDDTLYTELTLRPRVIYTRSKVQNDVKRILTLYRRKGRFAASVDPKVIQLDQNRVDLVFEINEGKWTEVQNIRFIGNKKYSDSQLRKVIRTRETRWYRYFSSDDNYDPDRLNLDRELLRRYYMGNGYADFRVLSSVAELTPDRKNFFITFMVEEGERYAVGEVDLDIKLRDLKAESIRESINISQGDWYDAEQVEKIIGKLTNKIGTLGFSFIDIRPQVTRNREKNTIDVTFEIAEGPRLFVERINVEGNVRTSDEVIRREFRLVEGDAFNASKLRRSKQRIDNLDFFENVTMEQVPGSEPDKTAINVGVEEKSTGSLSLGFGFSTTDGPLFDVGLSERNLMGEGNDLTLHGVLSGRSSRLNLKYTEPYFLDRDISAGFDLFHSASDNQDTSSFSTKQTGGVLRANYPFTEELRQSWSYTIKKVRIEDVSTSASQLVQDAAGNELVSMLTHGETYDKRDSVTSPTDGYILGMTNSFAGIGGTKRFFRNKISAQKYIPIYDQVVLSFGGGIGHILGIGEEVGLFDRFFLGGDDLRGFSSRGVGPRDSSTKDALGGEWIYHGSTQVNFPLGLPDELGLSGKLFTDFGSTGQLNSSTTSVNDTSSLRLSIGTGLDWSSPFGPIGIDFGFPLVKESFDQTETIRVNFGTRF